MKINLTKEQYADFTMSFLFDAIMNKDEVVPDNEDFQSIMSIMEKKGMRSLLLKYYLGMSSDMRVNYKRLKKSFTGEATSTDVINLIQNKGDKH